MKYTIIGDIQLQTSNIPKVQRLLDQVEQMGNPTVFLGDLLERRGHIEANCLNLLFDYFRNSSLQHNLIIGNHCLLSMHSTETALEPLKALENVTVVDEPTYLKTDGPHSSILMVPYYRNPQKFLEAINDPTNEPKPTTLICHQGVKEFTLGSGYTETEAVNISDLEQFQLVICGHYHSPQKKANIVYIGSPFSHSFGESNENKRLAILETETNTLEYIPTDFPQHWTHEVVLTDEADDEISYLESLCITDYHRMIVHGSDKQIKKFQKISERFSHIKFIYKPIGGQTTLLADSMTNSDKWTKWAKEIKKLDEETINLGLELLK